MIRPPRGSWSFISRNAACVQRNAPVRLTSTTRRHCSNVSLPAGHGRAVPGVVEQQVEAAERSSFVVEQRPDRARVARRRQATRARRLRPPARGRPRAARAGGRPARPSSLVRERQRRRPADAAARAGDDGDPSHAGRSTAHSRCASRHSRLQYTTTVPTMNQAEIKPPRPGPSPRKYCTAEAQVAEDALKIW